MNNNKKEARYRGEGEGGRKRRGWGGGGEGGGGSLWEALFHYCLGRYCTFDSNPKAYIDVPRILSGSLKKEKVMLGLYSDVEAEKCLLFATIATVVEC